MPKTRKLISLFFFILDVINTPGANKWYGRILQRIGIWKYITSPLYILVVLYLSILLIATILLSVTWYPWVYTINNQNKQQSIMIIEYTEILFHRGFEMHKWALVSISWSIFQQFYLLGTLSVFNLSRL